MAEKRDGKAAAAMHDRFNLYAITPLVLLTAVAIIAPSERTGLVLSQATFAYVVIDIVYNLLIPHCQPHAFRLTTIVVHHLFTLWLVLHPCVYPENSDMTAACTVVEVNTLILTANKVLKRKSLTIAFYVTWVGMRLVWYPYLTWVNHTQILKWGATFGDYHYNQVVVSMVALCLLNYLWTAEVVWQLVTKKPGRAKKAQ